MGVTSDPKSSAKSSQGNFFEDFSLGQVIVHATPRTLTAGDAAVYSALYGSRFAVPSSDAFVRAVGIKAAAATAPTTLQWRSISTTGR